MADRWRANQQAAGAITWVTAEFRVHGPLQLLEGGIVGGCRAEDDIEPEENTRKVV